MGKTVTYPKCGKVFTSGMALRVHLIQSHSNK